MDATKTKKDHKLHIPIWGPTSAGKSTYLVALYIALRTSDWDIWPDDPKTFRFLDEHVSLLEQGRFSAPNPVNVPPSSYLLNLTRLNPRHDVLRSRRMARLLLIGRKVLQLSLWDAPGEIFEDPLAKEETFCEIARFRPFFDAIRSASGVLCLLDLDSTRRMFYRQFIRRALFVLQRDPKGKVLRQVERPVAWVITKIDLPRRWESRYDPRGYAVQVLGSDLVQEVERTCRRCSWHAVSSVGVIQEDSQVVSNFEAPGDSDSAGKIRGPKARQPFCVADPIIWMLEQLSWWWRHG